MIKSGVMDERSRLNSKSSFLLSITEILYISLTPQTRCYVSQLRQWLGWNTTWCERGATDTQSVNLIAVSVTGCDTLSVTLTLPLAWEGVKQRLIPSQSSFFQLVWLGVTRQTDVYPISQLNTVSVTGFDTPERDTHSTIFIAVSVTGCDATERHPVSQLYCS